MNDWKIFEKNANSSTKYDAIDNELAIAVAQNGRLVFSRALYKALGDPEKILILTSGNMFAIRPTSENDKSGYAVRAGGGKRTVGVHRNVTVNKFVKERKLKPGNVFKGTIDGKMIVFNTNNISYLF